MNIEYAIKRSSKRKTVSIVIRSDNRIEVLAPVRMPAERIASLVQDKSNWIHRKLYFNREIKAAYVPKTFTPGEQFHLLGKSYSLHIQQGKRSVQHSESDLLVSHPSPDPDTTHRQICRWYQQQADVHFHARSYFFAAIIGKHPASVGVKSYKSRWGSCHHDGRIYFNWRLIMAPDWVVDYVVVHELCHLHHPNHSKEFRTLVQSISPACREATAWLKINGQTLSL
ncbi:MAG: SprT family zinc-dependent metalloprotease [Mariprofundus sp.]|nr:SprT family zinc-dependent metalloprotease [Mariprofundus sp.]